MAMNEQKYRKIVLHLRRYQEDPDFDFGVEVRRWLEENSEDPLSDYLEIAERYSARSGEQATGDDDANEEEWVKVGITRATVRGHCCALCGVPMGDLGPDFFVVIWERGPVCDQCARRVMPDYHEMLAMWRESRSRGDSRCEPRPEPGLLH